MQIVRLRIGKLHEKSGHSKELFLQTLVMMKKNMQKIKMPSIKEMIATAKESGVRFHACSPTLDMMGLKKEDLIPEVDDIIGAATYLELASEDAITLFV